MAETVGKTLRPVRQPGWQIALSQYLAEAGRQQFQWGTHDCALFAAGAVAAMTGVDPAARWRGKDKPKYRTLRGGLGLMRRAGFVDHADVAARMFEEVPVATAQPGDLAAIRDGELFALGVVQGEWIYVLQPDGRLGLVELMAAARVFRVPLPGMI